MAKASIKPRSRRKRRSARGVLWVIVLCLATSGVIRLGVGSGQAIASELAALTRAAPDAADCPGDDGITEVLALLQEREGRLAERESAMAARLQALAVAEEQITRNMTALKEAETSLTATMALASSAAEDDLTQLTAVYENMKPKEAAQVFAAMDPKFAAGFLGRMRTDAAAAIMAGLEPDTAYAISVLLAGRNAAAPTE
jgi:flagellar motility protein MotE (MotC chaperone)